MDTASTQHKVRQCSKCTEDTEYFCKSCQQDMCFGCKMKHVQDLQTIDHNVVLYCMKFKHSPNQEICTRHSEGVYEDYCELCKLPFTYRCTEHKVHKQVAVRTANDIKLNRLRGIIHTIRNEAFLYRPVLHWRIKTDVKTFYTELSNHRSKISSKTVQLQECINNAFQDFDFIHRCLKQKKTTNEHLASIQNYVNIYEQSAIKPVKFLLSIKKSGFPAFNLTHHCKLHLSESHSREGVMELLSKIQIKEGEKRCVDIESLFKIMSPQLHHSFIVTGFERCLHISCVGSNWAWVSHKNNLVLINTNGEILQHLKDLRGDIYSDYGLHTVNKESELIYIDKDYNIKKFSNEIRQSTILIEKTEVTWKTQCVYFTPSTEDLLVGMCKKDTWTGKVNRYNQKGKLTQTIQHDNVGMDLLKSPHYITENTNGDIVISDYYSIYMSGAVVVTERGGRHRFSYTGLSKESKLEPRGICTDALSHILISDVSCNTVHLLDKDGNFLSYLLTRPSGIFLPWSLGYDGNTHRLWVGSVDNNNVCVYRYITRRDVVTDQNEFLANAPDSLGKVENKEIRKKTDDGNLHLLKSPKLHNLLTVKGVGRSAHISHAISDRIWISDDECNLILTDTTGETLYHLKSLCSSRLSSGMHTKDRNRGVLFFIDRSYNIKTLSTDMKTISLFIKRNDPFWEPLCLYWSPATGDLLVGMFRKNEWVGQVIRYNICGKQTQKMQYDNFGQKQYRQPCYITENNNGDVVVSDWHAVVVTKRGGRHRFSYTGHPSGSGLEPQGICTDALSHILVCDRLNKSVQMIDKCGQFISHLLTESEIEKPQSLSYDFNTHHLWVGSWNNKKVCVYKYITEQEPVSADVTDIYLPVKKENLEKQDLEEKNEAVVTDLYQPAKEEDIERKDLQENIEDFQ